MGKGIYMSHSEHEWPKQMYKVTQGPIGDDLRP